MRENREVQRAQRAGCLVLGLLFLFVVLLASVGPFTEYLWYTYDIHQYQVFARGYSARSILFLIAFVPTWTLVYFSLRQALSLSLVYLRRPDSASSLVVSNVLGWIQDRGRSVVYWAAPVISFLSALGFSNEWQTWLKAAHAQPFGMKDPTYQLDVGFFVFHLPWYQAIANYVFAVLLLTGILTTAIYVGLQSLAAIARIELGRPRIRMHMSMLLAALLLTFAVQQWLKTYEIGLMDNTMFTGAGYAGTMQVGAQKVLAVLTVIVALLVAINAKAWKPYVMAIGGLIALAAFYMIGVVAVPNVTQSAYVGVNFAKVEAPFAEKAIRMTRFAYSLDKIETHDFDVKSQPSQQQFAASKSTIDNMRLWDPDVMRASFESLQGLRNYYSFDDVDIDRYTVDGEQTMVMLAPREIDPGGLDNSGIWNIRRERYTHGYGAVVARVNGSTSDGKPEFLSKDIPVDSKPPFDLKVPQVYFGDRRDEFGMPVDDYAVVNSREQELDYQVGSTTATTAWSGKGGIPISPVLARIAFAFALGDQNFLVASNLTSGSKLLINRNVVERASKAYPFLLFDNDPYIVVQGGRLIWILDGYTYSDRVPYSAMARGEQNSLNYIRNPVKVTVDAYSGEPKCYAIDPNEPILSTYSRIYPGLIRPISEMDPELRAHFRYPEDLLKIQCQRLSNYHVTDPSIFLNNGDLWQIAVQRGTTGAKEPMRPYYVQMRLPDEPYSGFLQILPFTPVNKGVLSGWLAAHCDPEQYGRLTMYRFRTGAPPPGPELMETSFVSSSDISYINRTFNNEQSEILVGNLLVIPIGESVMYVEPLFLRSKAEGLQNAPPLFRVVLALKDKIVVKPTYREALDALFGEQPTASSSTQPNQGTGSSQATYSAKQALGLLNQADQAMRSGDWAKYGNLQKRLRSVLEEVVKEQDRKP